MADWLFTSVTEPNIATGQIDVPTSSTQISAGSGRLVFASVTNVSAGIVKIKINNAAGSVFVLANVIPDGMPMNLPILGLTYVGLWWNQVDGSPGDLNGQVQSYEA